jgi:hypothetical protein
MPTPYLKGVAALLALMVGGTSYAVACIPIMAPKFVVFFPTGSAELTKEAQLALTDFAARTRFTFAPGCPFQVVIYGHMDGQESSVSGTNVDQRRADAVSDFIRRHDVVPARMRTEALAFTAPYEPTAPGAESAVNRRVRIIAMPDYNDHNAALTCKTVPLTTCGDRACWYVLPGGKVCPIVADL